MSISLAPSVQRPIDRVTQSDGNHLKGFCSPDYCNYFSCPAIDADHWFVSQHRNIDDTTLRKVSLPWPRNAKMLIIRSCAWSQYFARRHFSNSIVGVAARRSSSTPSTLWYLHIISENYISKLLIAGVLCNRTIHWWINCTATERSIDRSVDHSVAVWWTGGWFVMAASFVFEAEYAIASINPFICPSAAQLMIDCLWVSNSYLTRQVLILSDHLWAERCIDWLREMSPFI